MKKSIISIFFFVLIVASGCQNQTENLKKETTDILAKQTAYLVKGEIEKSSDYVFFKNAENKKAFIEEGKKSYRQLQSANTTITVGNSLYVKERNSIALSLIELTYQYDDLSYTDVTAALFIKKEGAWKTVLKTDLTEKELETVDILATELTNKIKEDEQLNKKLQEYKNEQMEVSPKIQQKINEQLNN